MSPDAKIRRKGIDANKAALDCCRAAGIETLVGPYHSALGCFSGAGRYFGDGRLPREKRSTVTNVREVYTPPKGGGEHELLESGLLGPARVLFAEE